MSLPSMHFGPLVSLFCWRLLLSRSFDACSQACFFSPARFCRICPDRRVVLALCFRSASAVKAVGVDGSATQPLFPRHLRPLSFCGTTVSSLLRRHRRTPLGGRGAWRSGPSSSSLLLFPLSLMVGEHSAGFDGDRISTPGRTTDRRNIFPKVNLFSFCPYRSPRCG